MKSPWSLCSMSNKACRNDKRKSYWIKTVSEPRAIFYTMLYQQKNSRWFLEMETKQFLVSHFNRNTQNVNRVVHWNSQMSVLEKGAIHNFSVFSSAGCILVLRSGFSHWFAHLWSSHGMKGAGNYFNSHFRNKRKNRSPFRVIAISSHE